MKRDSTYPVPDDRQLTLVSDESNPSAYSDALYRSASRESNTEYGYNPSRYYTGDENSYRGPIGTRTLFLICLICALFASILGIGGMYLLTRDKTRSQPLPPSASFYVQARQALSTSGPLHLAENNASAPLSGEELYPLACRQVAGVSGGGRDGTGIILTSDGYILTCYHVISRCYLYDSPITIVLYDGSQYNADIVGSESDIDLAVLKIDTAGLSPAALGDSDLLSVGERVYTLGNPSPDLPYTITRGVISSLDRQISIGSDGTAAMFQFDAAIGSGSSGGPVYNESGQVVGVATAKYIENGAEGLGFAIPTADAVSVANELIDKGYVAGKAYLGIVMDSTYTPAVARYYRGRPGAYVTRVVEGSAAQTAGLQPGDVIIEVDNHSIDSSDALVSVIHNYKAGDQAVLTVWRSGNLKILSVTFGEVVREDN